MEFAHRKLLIAAGCLIAAGAAVIVIVAVARRSPSHETLAAHSSPPAATGARSDAREDGATQPEEQAETERSQLPYVLLGTFAASEPSLSRATLRHRDREQTIVVRVGDEIEGPARVEAIERERVLLREDGSLRELRLDSDPRRVATSEAPPPAAETSLDAAMTDLERDLDDATGGQAKVSPVVEDGKVVGLHFSEIRDGTHFARMPIQQGDVITQFNDIPIDSPDGAMNAVRAMQESDRFHVVVRRDDGLTEYHGRWNAQAPAR